MKLGHFNGNFLTLNSANDTFFSESVILLLIISATTAYLYPLEMLKNCLTIEKTFASTCFLGSISLVYLLRDLSLANNNDV